MPLPKCGANTNLSAPLILTSVSSQKITHNTAISFRDFNRN